MKILMVCLGNICRSPLAHGIFESLTQARNLHWTIDSAGTGNWHVGQAPDPRSIAIAQKHGIDIRNQRAQQFQNQFFDDYDLIFAMDPQNYSDIKSLAKTPDEIKKIRLFLKDGPVPDPYYDDQQFARVFELIHIRSQELIDELSQST